MTTTLLLLAYLLWLEARLHHRLAAEEVQR
jgi:hypothetical protein